MPILGYDCFMIETTVYTENISDIVKVDVRKKLKVQNRVNRVVDSKVANSIWLNASRY